MSLRVEPLVPELAAACDRFVQAHPLALVYHRRVFLDLLADLLDCDEASLVALEDDEVRGFLPLMRARGPLGDVLNSLPFFGSNGGVLAHGARAERALVEAYNLLATRGGTLSATVVGHPRAPPGAPDPGYARTHGDHRVGLVTRLDPAGDLASLLARVDSRTRRAHRKAAREGVQVAREPLAFPALRAMHRANMAAIGGRAKEDRFFDLLPRRLLAGRDYDLWVARRDGEPAAALLTLTDGRTMEYYVPAVAAEHRPAQPLVPLVAEAMLDAARRGHGWWNWGGTWPSQDGVYTFKKQWDPQETRYAYHTQLNDPEVLGWAPEDVLRAYPGFYVVSFAALRREVPA